MLYWEFLKLPYFESVSVTADSERALYSSMIFSSSKIIPPFVLCPHLLRQQKERLGHKKGGTEICTAKLFILSQNRSYSADNTVNGERHYNTCD